MTSPPQVAQSKIVPTPGMDEYPDLDRVIVDGVLFQRGAVSRRWWLVSVHATGGDE